MPDPNGSLVERARRDGGRGGERDCCRSRILAANGRAGWRTADRADPGRPDRDLRRDRGRNAAETPATVVEQGPTAADTPIANREPAVDTPPAAQPARDVPPPTVPAAGLERKRRPSRKVVAAVLLLIVLIGAGAAIAIAMSSSSGSKTSSGAPPAPATPPGSPPVGKLAVASFHVGRAVAGGSLAALLTVRQSGFARSAAANVLCRGAIGDRPIAATRSVSGGVGTCRWQVPVEAAGRTLAGTVAIRRGHVSVSRGFSLRVNPSPGKVVLAKAPVIASGPKAGQRVCGRLPAKPREPREAPVAARGHHDGNLPRTCAGTSLYPGHDDAFREQRQVRLDRALERIGPPAAASSPRRLRGPRGIVPVPGKRHALRGSEPPACAAGTACIPAAVPDSHASATCAAAAAGVHATSNTRAAMSRDPRRITMHPSLSLRFSRWAVVGLGLVLALVAAGAAVQAAGAQPTSALGKMARAASRPLAKTTNSANFTDKSGDGPLDVTSVGLSNDDQPNIHIDVNLGTAIQTSTDEIIVFIDTDANPNTGGQSAGADNEIVLNFPDNTVGLAKWDGSSFSYVNPPAPSLTASYGSNHVGIDIKQSDLGGSAAFNFWVGAFRGDTEDRAPDSGVWRYDVVIGAPPPPPPPPAPPRGTAPDQGLREEPLIAARW